MPLVPWRGRLGLPALLVPAQCPYGRTRPMGGATVETVETPFTEILVPLDGSPAAERALAPALELVRRTGVPLRVLSRARPDEKETRADYLAGAGDRHAT